MKYLFYTCLLSVLLAVACKDNANKEPQATDPATVQEDSVVETLDTLLSDETIQTFSTSALSDYAKKKAPGFDWNKFSMTSSWEDSSLLVSPFKPDKNFFASYGPFLKYSPDKSMFIDLDSYNIDIQKDSKGRFTGNEIGPDFEVSLVNLKDSTRTRLVFLGPGGSIEDGLWLDDNTLVLMGVHENEKGQEAATLWRYHLPTKTYYLYELSDTAVAGSLRGYWKTERLKNVQIK
ncbi:MAG: hypothetical protein J7621_05380 [Niastella sp.]|nr:hypothetical protein [Niastella sp.]